MGASQESGRRRDLLQTQRRTGRSRAEFGSERREELGSWGGLIESGGR